MSRRDSLRATLLAGLIVLAGCDSWDSFQRPPNISSPGTLDNIPTTESTARTIAAANVPPLPPAAQGALWRPGSKTFFRDPRARGVGDLVTVSVNLKEEAQFANQTKLDRKNANEIGLEKMFGLGTMIARAVPGLAGTDPSLSVSGQGSTVGQGDIKRSENIQMNIAATVVQVLPNKNLEIAGSQEIRLNNELRQLQIRGIVRPEDIRSDNTITSEKIADARIQYGGRGVSSTLQRPSWGQDILNRLSPF
ncbi:MAG: flagellar basal body L-ring protein FlgH [Acetobacteraceae bacterium]